MIIQQLEELVVREIHHLLVMMLTCGRHARSRCSRHHITRLHTGFHVTVGVSDFRILRNVGETNHTQIQIQYRGIEVLHLHLHLQTLLRQVIIQQLEELVVREIHHLLVMMLTCGRHARSRCSRHHITRLHTGFHVTVGVSDFRILRNVGETNHTQIQIQYRGIEVLHLHLHLQTLLRQVIL